MARLFARNLTVRSGIDAPFGVGRAVETDPIGTAILGIGNSDEPCDAVHATPG